MKYYIMLGTLISSRKYQEEVAKQKAIEFKKMFPRTNVQIIEEDRIKKGKEK